MAGAPASGWDRVHFAGYSLFTLDNGEFRPDSAIWQIMTVLAALSGLTAVSLAIAYLVLVTSAAAERHAVAVQISLLGSSPVAVAEAKATAPHARQLETLLSGLAGPIVEFTQRHLAYPVLHFFHGAEPRSSPPRASRPKLTRTASTRRRPKVPTPSPYLARKLLKKTAPYLWPVKRPRAKEAHTT